jgi:hypothetical protein
MLTLLCSPAMADTYSFITDRKGIFDSPLFLIILLVGAVFAIGVMSDR